MKRVHSQAIRFGFYVEQWGSRQGWAVWDDWITNIDTC